MASCASTQSRRAHSRSSGGRSGAFSCASKASETVALAVTQLECANLKKAQQLVIAIPDCFEAGQIVEQARKANPSLRIVARAHSDAEERYLREYGASEVIQGSRETAEAMLAALKGDET